MALWSGKSGRRFPLSRVISTIKLSTHRLRAISDACRNCFQQAFSFVSYSRLSVNLIEYFLFVVLAGMFSLCSW